MSRQPKSSASRSTSATGWDGLPESVRRPETRPVHPEAPTPVARNGATGSASDMTSPRQLPASRSQRTTAVAESESGNAATALSTAPEARSVPPESA